MIDILFEIGISNAVVSLAIAVIAVAVGKLFKRPHLAYFLWLLVLVKLLMPSFMTIPFPVGNEALPENQTVAVTMAETSAIAAAKVADSNIAAVGSDVSSINLAAIQNGFRTYFPMIWGLGILIALGWSLFRVFRFNRLLRFCSDKASDEVYAMAKELSATLDLKKLPSIYATSAEITPMVWWVGGKVRIYIPAVLVENMEQENMRLVLAHELAHVRRRDYLVRWIEWSTAVLFWWNPIVWWAQRNLRAYEEICCDALILSSLKPEPHQYASSLLSAVEEFAGSAVRPPSMASEVNSGGYLVRRIHMILSKENNRTLSSWLQVLVFCFAVMILPLGFVNGQDVDVSKELTEARQRLKAEVEAGKISEKEAMAEMAALKSEIAYRKAEEKINRAVVEGNISPENAAAKLADLKERGMENAKRDVEMKLAAEELEKSVRTGKISKDEAKAKMMELKLRFHMQKRDSEVKRAARQLEEAVSMNKISVDEAEAKLAAMKLKLAYAVKADAMKMAAEKLEYAMESGRISRKEAEHKMQELKLRYVEQKNNVDLTRAASKLKALVQSNKISAAEAEAKMRALKRNYADAESAYRVQSAAEKLRYAVEAGKVSKEEAKLKLEKLGLHHNLQKMKAELKRASAELKAAVKAGKLTADEAKVKLKLLQMEMEKSDN